MLAEFHEAQVTPELGFLTLVSGGTNLQKIKLFIVLKEYSKLSYIIEKFILTC